MQFLASLPPPGPARDASILAAIAAGKLDSPTWIQIELGRVTLTVSADWLTIDGARIPMSAYVAQTAVNALDALLPTLALVEAIESGARAAGRLVPFVAWPHWQDDSQLATTTIAWREAGIAAHLATMPEGAIVAGCLKDVVVAPFMRQGRVSIFGGLDGKGRRVQPLYPDPHGSQPGHGAFFDGGYAHGVRAVRNDCLLDGAPAKVSEILTGPDAHLLGGPVAMLRYPTAGAPAAQSHTATSSPGTSTTTTSGILARGAHGEAVKEVQVLLGKAGFQTAADGVYGQLTESAVRSYQGEFGLVQDGKVGPKTLASLRGVSPPDSAPEDTLPDLSDVPLPLDDTERVQVFGSFEWVPAPRVGEPGGIRVLGTWVKDNIVTITVPQLVGVHNDPGGRVTCHRLAATAILRFFEAVEKAGKMHLVLSFDGCWNPRIVRGGTTLSNHAFGTDFDLNAQWNPRGKAGPAAGEKGSVVELVPIVEACGLGWGGNWSTPDYMHVGVRVPEPFTP